MAGVYPYYQQQLANSTRDWDADTIRAALVTSSYTFSTAHQFMSSISGELTGGTYARQAVTGNVVSLVAPTIYYRADNITWAALAPTAPTTIAAVILFAFITNDAASPLCCYIELDTPVVTNGTDFEIEFATVGGDNTAITGVNA